MATASYSSNESHDLSQTPDAHEAFSSGRPDQSEMEARSSNASRIWRNEGTMEATPTKRPGPGRKSRACRECKRQKMKCEVPPGSRECTHCLRRDIECSLQFTKPSMPSNGEGLPSTSTSVQRYEQKIDALYSELNHMRSTLDALVQRGAAIIETGTGVEKGRSMQQEFSSTPYSNPAQTLVSDSSAREDNMQMAMTRENSMDSEQTPHEENSQNGALTVNEPMSSLYEVTRLRNIRSNQSRTTRPLAEDDGKVNDFITRGVISESEAEELYIMQVSSNSDHITQSTLTKQPQLPQLPKPLPLGWPGTTPRQPNLRPPLFRTPRSHNPHSHGSAHPHQRRNLRQLLPGIPLPGLLLHVLALPLHRRRPGAVYSRILAFGRLVEAGGPCY